jgi:hypothetical protein
MRPGEQQQKQTHRAKGRPTPGVLASGALGAEVGAAATAFAELAFVTSRRLEPAALATLRIFVPPPPFFSFVVSVSALESSWPLRAAFEGAMGGRGRKRRGCWVEGNQASRCWRLLLWMWACHILGNSWEGRKSVVVKCCGRNRHCERGVSTETERDCQPCVVARHRPKKRGRDPPALTTQGTLRPGSAWLVGCVAARCTVARSRCHKEEPACRVPACHCLPEKRESFRHRCPRWPPMPLASNPGVFEDFDSKNSR